MMWAEFIEGGLPTAMEPGELLVVRMSGGVSIARCIALERDRVRIAVSRNREARLTVDRVALATGVSAASPEAEDEFRLRVDKALADIDLAEVWDVVEADGGTISLDDIAELHWEDLPDTAHRVAMLLYLEREGLYFVRDDDAYAPRPRKSVEETLERRRREAENDQAAQELADCLRDGGLPSDPSGHQKALLAHLRGFAVHGDSYTRSAPARSLLDMVGGPSKDYQRLAFETLVDVGVLTADQPLELERAGIDIEFSADALREARSIDPSTALGQSGRTDLTDVAAITIDDEGTMDRDDALSVEVVSGGGGAPETYRVGVHITDGGSLIPRDSALDRDADRRMSTLYMPDGKVPMLPAEVSEAAGSLLPGEHRAALSLMVSIDPEGRVLDWEVSPSVIVSQAALSYEEADGAVADAGHPWHRILAPLDGVAQALRRRREAAGAVLIERPEMSIKVTPSGEVSVDVVPRSTPARQLVTEFMVLCNSLLAEFCNQQGIPAAYRSQSTPDLSDIGGESEGPLHWYTVIRRMPPAELATVPGSHGGLGVDAYIQATSPLRRYPDLVMQRQISRYLESGTPLYTTEEIASVAQRADAQLRELGRLEEDRKRYWFLKYLRQRVQEPFDAVVLENPTNRPGLLELADYPFRVRARLPGAIQPGDDVTLTLHGVDLWARVAQFVHEPHD